MSKSGNYNLGEIEKRDAVIQELGEALRSADSYLDGITAQPFKGYKAVKRKIDKALALLD